MLMAMSLSASAQQLLPYQNTNLSVEARANDLLSRLTLEEKMKLMMDTSPAIARLGIPQFQWWNEALHGVGRNGFVTVFPITMHMAASWDDTCLDTSGNPFTREEPFYFKFEKLMEVTDLFMLDIKEIDEEEHRKLTGQTNKNILDMARCLSEHGKKMWIRHVLVPGITDDEGQLTRLRAFIDTLETVERVEVLPYHTLGVFKWKELGIPYALEDVNPPSAESVARAREILGCEA